MAKLHSILTANHRPYADVYADATERLAATGFVRALGGGVVAFTADDLYKKVLQLDNATEWILTAITPTWVRVSGAETGANSDITSMDGLTGALQFPTMIDFPEAVAPGTPAANNVRLYAKADGKLYIKDDAGTETDLAATGGGGTPAGSDTQFQYNNAGVFGGAGELKRVTGGNGPKVQFDGGANAAWLQIKANSGSTYLTSEGADGVGFHTGEDYGNTNLGNTWVNISRVVQLKAQGQGNDPTASGFGIIYFREQALKLKYSEDGATAKELTPRRGSTTWNPASLGDGAVESTTVTVSGVAVGDPCFASLSTIGSNNFQITAHVESSDTVRVVLRNVSGGTVDLASGTLNVLCWKA